jgi:hypothetical protein
MVIFLKKRSFVSITGMNKGNIIVNRKFHNTTGMNQGKGTVNRISHNITGMNQGNGIVNRKSHNIAHALHMYMYKYCLSAQCPSRVENTV